MHISSKKWKLCSSGDFFHMRIKKEHTNKHHQEMERWRNKPQFISFMTKSHPPQSKDPPFPPFLFSHSIYPRGSCSSVPVLRVGVGGWHGNRGFRESRVEKTQSEPGRPRGGGLLGKSRTGGPSLHTLSKIASPAGTKNIQYSDRSEVKGRLSFPSSLFYCLGNTIYWRRQHCKP